jgi:hypothetical protein|tara:strand:+ start:2391 stop:2750 length:360 start_codon:yes stop_codon:yes gene_type:complete
MLPLSDVKDVLIGYFLESYFKWFSTTTFIKNTALFWLCQRVAIIYLCSKSNSQAKMVYREACKWRMTRCLLEARQIELIDAATTYSVCGIAKLNRTRLIPRSPTEKVLLPLYLSTGTLA